MLHPLTRLNLTMVFIEEEKKNCRLNDERDEIVRVSNWGKMEKKKKKYI